jgi:hypothetical protein
MHHMYAEFEVCVFSSLLCAKCAQCGYIVVCVAAADNCSTNLQDRLVQERLYTSQIQTEG